MIKWANYSQNYSYNIASILDNIKSQYSQLGKYHIIFPKEMSDKNGNKNINSVYTLNERIGELMEYDNIISKQFLTLDDNRNNKKIKLNSAIVFKIEVENCGFYYINEKYNIYAFGETQEEVENNLFDAFMDQYESYALEKDENLTEKSLILKDNLLKIFGGIECLD